MIKLIFGSFWHSLLDYLLHYMEYYLYICEEYQTNKRLVHKKGENISSTFSGWFQQKICYFSTVLLIFTKEWDIIFTHNDHFQLATLMVHRTIIRLWPKNMWISLFFDLISIFFHPSKCVCSLADHDFRGHSYCL